MTSKNLSLIQYVPCASKRLASLLALLGFSAVALFASKRADREDVIPWFFITNLYLPIIWSEHLTSVIPASLFLVLYRSEWERVMICIFIVLVVFFAGVSGSPVLVNALLLCLWLWQVHTMVVKARRRRDQLSPIRSVE